MEKRLALTILALLLVCGLGAIPGSAGVESLLGKWQVKAESPNGPIDVEFVFRLEGSQIQGTATTGQGSAPFSAIKFDEPGLAMDLVVGDNTYRLKGMLKEGKLEGTWERVGSEVKGAWAGTRSAAVPPAAAPAGGVLGAWNTVAVTPNGEMAATLELKQEGEKFSGVISSDMGSLPVQAISFKESKLQFDLELGGNTYRILATLEGDRLNGSWTPAAGGEGGAWKAIRKAAVAAPAPAPQTIPAIVGSWNVAAVSPEGTLKFVADFKQTGDTLSGVITTPDGTITLQKTNFANGRLTFEVEYMGGNYRIEAALENDKLTGKWSALEGSESGTLTGERKKS